MSTQPMAYYRKQIDQANTKEELRQISYNAFRDDDQCLVGNRKMNRIDALCILREVQLGLLRLNPQEMKQCQNRAATGR